MRLRAELDEYTFADVDQEAWVASPMPGVERLMLDRDGDEVAVATSIVRYAPNSSFSGHEHALGEEYLVLEGEFADNHGRYGVGTYVRNPPGSSHVPFSDPGCVIFVKLRQFAEDDARQCVTALADELPSDGVAVDLLHQHRGETVRHVRAAPEVRVAIAAAPHAQEAFVISGAVSWQTDVTRTLGAWSWFRVPPGCPLRYTTREASRVLVKTRPKWHAPL